jgi:hypothetical protein
MKRPALYICLAALLLLAAPVSAAQPDMGCVDCHKQMTTPMPPPGKTQAHNLACTACHLGQGQAREANAAHQGMTPNPSALEHASRACGPCHPGWPEKVKASPMASNMGLINQTRYLWGAAGDAMPRFGVRSGPGLMALPSPNETGQPVDDFLRRRCLRCHLWGQGADMDGARRSSGCAACHRPYKNGQPPQGHGLTKRVPVSQCLTCHAGCGAGAEYTGRIPRDAREPARFMATNPEQPRLWQARAWRPMQPDLHYAAGLTCIDCHPRPEIMGDGKQRPAALLHVGLRCSTCHGQPGKPPKDALTKHGVKLDHVRPGKRGLVLTGKLDGKARIVPTLANGASSPVAHQVPEHGRVACHACHSAANPADWGLMVQLETRSVFQIWQPIAAQGDPQVLELLSRPLPKPPAQALPPLTRDYLSGELRSGLWIVSPFFRRFAWRVYGQAPDGRTMLLAPRFQYVITRLDENGRLHSQAITPEPGLGVTPWHAHTTRRATMGCADCHGKARALGLGLTFLKNDAPDKENAPAPLASRLAPNLWLPQTEGLSVPDWTQVVDAEGGAQQAFLIPGSRPYAKGKLRQLLQPGKAYKRWLLKALDQEWPWRPSGNKGPPIRPTKFKKTD